MKPQVLEGRDLRYPIDDTTLGRFLFNRLEEHHNRICQIDGTLDKTETYSSVKLRSTRVAIELQKRGVTSSDVIVLCCGNTIDNVIPILASIFLGAKVANLEKSLSVRSTKHLLSLVEPKIIFVEESSVDLIEKSLLNADFRPEIIVFGTSNKYEIFENLVRPQEDEEEFQPSQVDSDEVALIFFSSGSTGLPKAICHTHSTLLLATSCMYQIGFRGAILQFTNFYWITATLILLCSFKSGSYRVFCKDPSAGDVFKMIDKYKVQSTYISPLLTYSLTTFKNAHKYDTSSIKLICCGGTPMAPSQIQRMNTLFTSAKTILAYGMSEVGYITGFDPEFDTDLFKTNLFSCGRPVAKMRLKVVNQDTGEMLGPNQKGEICVSAASIMKGYLKLDCSNVFDCDNFLKTGDVGYYDEDGFVYVIERIKEMFKYQLWHIMPSAIEEVLLEHPGVKEAVVFGVPCGIDGEAPAACVVLHQDWTLTETDIKKYLEERVSERERLRGGVTFVNVLPKTPTGKIARREVRSCFINSNIVCLQ